ncbi:MAG: ABC transporter substrate-binding protein [Pseudolabrys sp.]|nr:ABC transporter substrate-binding protein [Pseudolabrys sp.]
MTSAPPPAAAQDSIYIPLFTYRTGPFSGSGIYIAEGMRDYLEMLNQRDGGIGGVKLQLEECETGYDTKKGLECYEAVKDKKPVVINPWSTGITLPLIPRAAVDKIPVLSMAYGLSAAAVGDTFPWIFNPPATYWDGGSMILSYIAGKEGGGPEKLKGRTIGYIYLDAGFGKEPIPLFEQLSKDYGFTLKLYPVAGTEMQNQSSQWLNVRRDKPDYMIMYGWGALQPTAVKEAVKINYPMDKFISIWWPSEDDAAAGGDGSKGFKVLNWHAVGADFPAIADIKKHVTDKNLTQTDKNHIGKVLYNRGIYNSILIAEGIRNAQKLSGKKVVTGEDVRRGLETLNIDAARYKEMGLEGFAGPVKLTCQDHNGHFATYMQEWDGTKWVRLPGELKAMTDKVNPLLEAAAKDYTDKAGNWPKRTEACDKAS